MAEKSRKPTKLRLETLEKKNGFLYSANQVATPDSFTCYDLDSKELLML